MEKLKQMILDKGQVIGNDILKVDMFLNHQIDIELLNEIGKEFKERFKDKNITKILTIESSGIAIACIAAQYFSVPVVFAKKSMARNMNDDTYSTEVYSYTKEQSYIIRVSKEFINENDNLLIIDDFLANGEACFGLINIIKQANAKVTGIGIVIEKGFQPGGNKLRNTGIQVESLAIIDSIINNGKVIFR